VIHKTNMNHFKFFKLYKINYYNKTSI